MNVINIQAVNQTAEGVTAALPTSSEGLICILEHHDENDNHHDSRRKNKVYAYMLLI